MAVKKKNLKVVIVFLLLVVVIVGAIMFQNKSSFQVQKIPTPVQTIEKGSLDSDLIVSRQLSDFDLLSEETMIQSP